MKIIIIIYCILLIIDLIFSFNIIISSNSRGDRMLYDCGVDKRESAVPFNDQKSEAA